MSISWQKCVFQFTAEMRPLANFTYFLFPTFCPSHNCNCWCGESSHLGKQFIVTTFKTNVRNVPYSPTFMFQPTFLFQFLNECLQHKVRNSGFHTFNCLSSLTCGICRRHSGDFQSKEGAGIKWILLTSFSRCCITISYIVSDHWPSSQLLQSYDLGLGPRVCECVT